MKKAYLFLAAFALFAASCDKIANLTDIEKDLSFNEIVDVPGKPVDVDTVLPGIPVIADLPKMAFATNSKDFLESNGSVATSEYVHHVKLTKFTASIDMPQNGNFDWTDSIYVYISASGLNEVLAASKTISKGQNSVDLNCKDIDLKEYFLKDSMYVRFGGRFVDLPQEGKIRIQPTFNIKANPLKKDE
jgi:hypothetical protein